MEPELEIAIAQVNGCDRLNTSHLNDDITISNSSNSV
jgi:hypothetical protein